MKPPTRRRDVLAAGVASAVAFGLPRALLGQSTAQTLSTVRLTDTLTLIQGAGANVTVLKSSDGALLVDGGLPERAADLRRVVASVAGSPDVRYLFNTNWRPEHNGLNETLAGTGTTILAHENTKLWMGADFEVQWENRSHEPRPEEALPNQTFYTEDILEFAGGAVEYGHLAQAHTDGDIYVFFPSADVLVVSDLLAVDGYPVVDYVTGGWIGGMEDATKALLEIADSGTRIIAATGAVQSRAELESQLQLCTGVREAVRDAYSSGHSLDEFLAARPAREFEEQRGDPALFLQLAYRGAWGHVRELGGGII